MKNKLDEIKNLLKIALQTIDEVKQEQYETELTKINETLKALVKITGELKEAII